MDAHCFHCSEEGHMSAHSSAGAVCRAGGMSAQYVAWGGPWLTLVQSMCAEPPLVWPVECSPSYLEVG